MERKGRKNELADPKLPAIRSIADGRAMPACQAPVPERLEKPDKYNCRGRAVPSRRRTNDSCQLPLQW